MMQGDVSGSGASERQRDQSSAKMSADSRSVDTQKTSLTEAEYKTSTYLECRLCELRVRKIETEKDISSLYKKIIDNLMKDVDDFKNRVQNDDHVGASRQYFLEECSNFQRELQHSWHTSLTKQQEYGTAAKKLKVAYPHEAQAVHSKDLHEVKGVPSKDLHEVKGVPSKDLHEVKGVPSKDLHEVKGVPSKGPHEAKAIRSTDQHVYTGSGEDSGLVPVESVEAHGHAEALTEKSTIKKCDPLINNQGHHTSSLEEQQNEVCATCNTRQEWVTNMDDGRNKRQRASSSKENIISVQAVNTQEEVTRTSAYIYTQGQPSRTHTSTFTQHEVSGPHDKAITDSQQQTVITTADVHVLTSTSTTSDAGVDTTAADYSQRSINKTDLPTGVDQGSIDLLLIGSCGNGKSATGNSILGWPAFRRTASSSVASDSSASSIKMESTEFAGKVVNVIDGPSINVSGNITPEEVGNIIEKVGKSLELCKFSFTALLIILKFGERFTKQEIEALRVIKAVLGKDVVSEYGVCVITYGDSFEYCMEEARDSGEEMTFEGWLMEQKGEVTNLFKECNYRCVLFNNVTKDGEKRQAQLDKLMNILPKGKRYSNNAFLQAMQSTQELEMEASLPTFLKEAQAEADKIRELIDQHEEIKMHDPEARNIKLKLRELKEKVNKMRISSDELESLKMSLNVLESNLNMKLKRWQLERDIEMNLAAQGKTLARSSTPALADQTTMAIRKTPHDWDMAAPLHFNKDTPASSDFNTGTSAPSNIKGDMSGPLGLATSINKTSSSVDNSSHAFSNTGSVQGLPFNDNSLTATLQMHDTGITDQQPDTSVNIKSLVIDKEMVSGEGNAPYASIIAQRVKNYFTSL